MTEFVLRITNPLELSGEVTIFVSGPPHSYLAAARSLAKGLQPLAAAGPESLPALALLAGQVAECALKAYLSRSGNDKRLKNPDIQHKLGALWALAHAEGLKVSAAAPAWLDHLAKLHGPPYPLRYISGHLVIAFHAADALVAEVLALLETCTAP
jgi:hypothetical protein